MKGQHSIKSLSCSPITQMKSGLQHGPLGVCNLPLPSAPAIVLAVYALNIFPIKGHLPLLFLLPRMLDI